MTRDVSALSSRPFDLLVIGGGIHGLIAAYDAARRGLEVALVERDDFASATSFNHLKTLHGGIRELQRFDIARVRAAVRERRAMARIAPHLVSPLGFLMPLYGGLTRNALVMKLALGVHAALTADRNEGVAAPLALPVGRVVSRAECLAMFPDAPAAGRVRGGLLWHDYQMHDADRLALSFALAAAEAGATLANYVEVTRLLGDGGRVIGASARDVLTGAAFDVRATVTLNAAGPWVLGVMAQAGVQKPITLFRNLNVVTSKPGGSVALVSPTDGGRALVAMPWRGRLIVGTYEASEPCRADEVTVPDSELDGFVDQIHRAFPHLRLAPADITLVHRGIVPAAEGPRGLTLKKRWEIWDHRADGVAGLVSMLGVKYTTARLVAERAVDEVAAQVDKRVGVCATATRPLPGALEPGAEDPLVRTARDAGLDDGTTRRLVSSYGSNAGAIVDCIRRDRHLGEAVAPGEAILKAQVIHAVREEMACRVLDVIARRTTLGSARHPGPAVVHACADLMKPALEWSAARVEAEIAHVEAFYARMRGGSAGSAR